MNFLVRRDWVESISKWTSEAGDRSLLEKGYSKIPVYSQLMQQRVRYSPQTCNYILDSWLLLLSMARCRQMKPARIF